MEKWNSTIIIVIVGALMLVGSILNPEAEWLKDLLQLGVGGLLGNLAAKAGE